jgi:uncharacterized protein YqeY
MLRSQLNESLKQAMRAKDQCAVSTLRLILAALKDRDIAARGKGQTEGVDEEQILEMLQKMVRQRRDSIEMYRKGQRQDLVEKEEAEIAVIERFLPQQMDEAAVREAVEGAISEQNAESVKDMGRVMAVLKERYAGRMDFAKASGMVKEQLS